MYVEEVDAILSGWGTPIAGTSESAIHVLKGGGSQQFSILEFT